MFRRLGPTRLPLVWGLAMALPMGDAGGQSPPYDPRAVPTAPARLIGRVVDRATGAPVAGAAVSLVDGEREVRSDSTGRFALLGLPSGLQRLRVSAEGWATTTVLVSLRPGREVERTIELKGTGQAAAQGLAPVTVKASADAVGSYRLADFDRRRRSGRGHYLSEEDILRSGASNLLDATRGLRGVSQECGGYEAGGGVGCRVHMVRAKRNCAPDYVVDGREDNMFGSSTPIRDIVALELYTGPSDMPAEFGGVSGGCGVVVIWTRAGPVRRTGSR
ncbi:MAG: carboxypeptidase-like regulatory domain-containing protein [Gemmatimonadaceae bacterium]